MEDQSRHGDFAQIMLPHLDAAYNLARWLVRDPTIAEDVVQDAYEPACRYFAAFKGGPGRAWLLQIVRSVAYAALRTICSSHARPGPPLNAAKYLQARS